MQYRALCAGDEAAFVAIDRWPDLDLVALYELYVPTALWGRGVGSAILQAVERLAAFEGFRIVRVTPHSLDGSLTQSAIEQWYERRRYAPVPDVPGEFLKPLSDDA